MKIKMISRYLVLGLAGLVCSAVGFARDFEIDASHSNVQFQLRHFMSKVNGDFRDFKGKFSFDEKKPESAKVDAEVIAASIDTHNEKRDTHLRSEDFFEVQKFPTLKFVSKKVVADGPKKYKVTGDLTLRGVTKPVTLDLELLGEMKDPKGKIRKSFTASTKINRKDFGMTWNKALDSGGMILGDDVEIHINVEGIEQAEKAAR